MPPADPTPPLTAERDEHGLWLLPVVCGQTHQHPEAEARTQAIRAGNGFSEAGGCGKSLIFIEAYRCVECGRWLHRTCAQAHFAEHGDPTAALTADLAQRTAERDAARAQLDEWDGVREHIRFLADSCEANSTVAAYENDGTPSPDIGGHMQRDRDVVHVVRQVLARTGSPRPLAAPTEG